MEISDMLSLVNEARGFTKYCHQNDPSLPFLCLSKQLLDTFSVSTLVGESIVAEKVYCDCTFSVNHKSTMTDIIQLDIVDFDVILGMDQLHSYYALID